MSNSAVADLQFSIKQFNKMTIYITCIMVIKVFGLEHHYEQDYYLGNKITSYVSIHHVIFKLYNFYVKIL